MKMWIHIIANSIIIFLALIGGIILMGGSLNYLSGLILIGLLGWHLIDVVNLYCKSEDQ